MKKTLILTGFLAAFSHADPWSDSLANAILSNNRPRQRQLIESRPGQCVAVTGLRNAAKTVQARKAEAGTPQSNLPDSTGLLLRPPIYGEGPWSVPAFEWALRQDFGNDCSSAFEQSARDTLAPETFRMAVLDVMMSGAKPSGAMSSTAVHAIVFSLLSSARTPVRLKAFLLPKIGKLTESSYGQDFVPFLTSADTNLRNAAYQGLIQKINANGMAGRTEENHAIFSSFDSLVSQPITLGQVRVLATLREDYARDFLLAKSAGDPKKVAIIFIRDGNVRHAGLIAEAAKLLRAEGNSAALQKAVAQGIKDPNGIISPLLAGSSANLKDGLTLLESFPKLAQAHAAFISESAQSSDPELKAVAQKLLPYLSTSASAGSFQ